MGKGEGMKAIQCTQCGAPLQSDTCEYCGSWYPNLLSDTQILEGANNPIDWILYVDHIDENGQPQTYYTNQRTGEIKEQL